MDYVYIEDCEVKATTDKALLVGIGAEDIWIARSQLHRDCELDSKGDEGDLIIPKWLAEDKDIEADGEY